MDVAVTGSSGLIGTALRDALQRRGDRVVRVVRGRASGADTIGWDIDDARIDAGALEGLDAVVHLAGHPIGDRLRWNEAHKARALESRVRGTRLLSEALASSQRPPALVSMSAIGYYGSRGEEELTEDSGPGTGFLADLVVAWEGATAPAREAGVRTAITRVGLVLSRDGGMLDPLLLPFKLGLGGPIGSGRQWWSWVDLGDVIGALLHLLDGGAAGPFNVVAPVPVRQRDFAKALGRALHRPAVLPLPAPAVRLALGEAADEMILTGSKVSAAKLTASGFSFMHPELDAALGSVLHGSRALERSS
jgi:uncharacterized protein